MSATANAALSAMEEALEDCLSTTVALAEAVSREEDALALAVAEARARSIDAFDRTIRGWLSLPEGARIGLSLEPVRRRRAELEAADAALKDQIERALAGTGEELSRLGAARRITRAYRSPLDEKLRLLNGKG